jgi:hypothetical protein
LTNDALNGTPGYQIIIRHVVKWGIFIWYPGVPFSASNVDHDCQLKPICSTNKDTREEPNNHAIQEAEIIQDTGIIQQGGTFTIPATQEVGNNPVNEEIQEVEKGPDDENNLSIFSCKMISLKNSHFHAHCAPAHNLTQVK